MSNLDRIRPGFDPRDEQHRLEERRRRAAELKDAWWLIVKDGRGMEKSGHAAAVRWARAGLGLDEPMTIEAMAERETVPVATVEELAAAEIMGEHEKTRAWTDEHGRLIVHLSPKDQTAANVEGRARYARNRRKLADKLGDRGRAMGEHPDLIGAGGELAVARWLGVPWTEAEIKRPGKRGDVAGLNVRARAPHDQRLPIRDRDSRRQPAVLVVANPPRYWIRGWIMPKEAERPEWRDDPGGYGLPAYFVPARDLHPISTLLEDNRVRAAMGKPPI